MALSYSNITIGDTVQFSTLNPRHNVLVYGEVSGICNLTTARKFSEVDAYHEQVLLNNLDIGDITSMQFITIESAGVTAAYALDWIVAESFKAVTSLGNATLLLSGVDMDLVNEALALLASNGFAVKLIKTP